MKNSIWGFIMLISINGMAQRSLLIGKTIGLTPFLEYGLGDDRLGGAKMTYLDSNIVMKVVDSVKDDYKVQLSTYHYAWLAKTSFQKDTAVHLQPYYLTNSWKVYGDDKCDYVTVTLDQRVPYRSIQEINPSKIVVDIFGVNSNTNWITQLSTTKEIKNAYYEQIEDDVFRVIIELKHQQHWGYFIYYDNNSLVIRVKRQPVKLTMQNLFVGIDAGHGGSNTGATGVTSNILEKDYTLKIAKEVQKYFTAKKVKTFMTRVGDTDLTMIDRTLMLREQDPHILISIHLNSSGKDTVKGVSTYYRYIGFRPLSQAILKRMLELKLNEFGNVVAFNFSLSGPTEYPNCLVEVAFLSNKDDEKRILNPKFHKQVAQKIYLGVDDWLKSLK
ncbi:MAG TPA: N-acetylmuramoyl-L-alanine amidase [Chitinophagaceae bacterium]|nr:N-acetylmuramoyl-L-alanine amidase [Chitinophagaceae bacterium]